MKRKGDKLEYVLSEKHDKMVEIVKLERVVVEMKDNINSLQ